MKRLAGLSTLALIISATSGCGWLWGDDGYFRDRGSDYLQAQQVPPMQVPAGANLRPIEPLLPIPQQVADSRASGDYEVPRPQRLVAAETASDFSLQTSEDGRWLVALRSPSETYTAVRQFFTDNGFQIDEERPQTGEFTTAWQTRDQLAPGLVRNLGLGGGETRVRVRVEPGVQRQTSEVSLLSVQRPAGNNADVAWPERTANAELDRVLLDEMQTALVSRADQGGSTSLLAEREFDAPSRVTLSEAGSGSPSCSWTPISIGPGPASVAHSAPAIFWSKTLIAAWASTMSTCRKALRSQTTSRASSPGCLAAHRTARKSKRVPSAIRCA